MNNDMQLLLELLAIPSVTEDVAAVNRAVECLRGYLDARGLHTATETLPSGRLVLYAANAPGKTPDFLFNAHLDVVPPSEPGQFSPRVEGDRLFARGAADCKGNAAVLAAALLALRDAPVPVGAVFSTDEETGGESTALMVARGYVPRRMVLILDAEPYAIVHAQKGTVSYSLRSAGRGGHSSEPWRARNPIPPLLDAAARLLEAFPLPPEGAWADTLVPTVLRAGTAHNQIPDDAELVVNVRFTTPGGAPGIADRIRAATGLDPVPATPVCEPVACDPSHPLMLALQAEMQRRFPSRPIPFIRMNAATDSRHFAALGLPIAILGTDGANLHAAAESVSLPSLGDYAALLADFPRLAP